MFVDESLINHLETKNGIKIDSLVIAEWNQNDLLNIKDYGNYRYRPESSSVVYKNLMPSYDQDDNGNFYTNALESHSISKYRTEDPNEPLIFLTKEQEREIYYSLKDCLKPFRPRSGINKILFFDGKYVDSIRSAKRPRYYFSSRNDQFKYWNSYRKEDGVEYGISSKTPKSTTTDIGYQINDTVPFVVYKNEVATNRIVVKMQTNLADTTVVGIDGEQILGTNIRTVDSVILDPLSDRARSTIPKRWKIQYLDGNNNWINAISFDETSKRKDGSNIVSWDGYVELQYGIKVPEKYKDSFALIESITSTSQLPISNILNGEAYIVGASLYSAGELYIWDTDLGDWEILGVTYDFSLCENDDTKRLGIVTKLIDPEYFINNGEKVYKEFIFLKGLRVVVETMESAYSTFNLIELSPRLKANISERVIGFTINKEVSATDNTLPVGGLAASTGNIELSNYDLAFIESNQFNKLDNSGSLVSNMLKPQIKFDFYETILDVDGYDKFIPLKTLYSENSIQVSNGMEDISLSLRDGMFLFESGKSAEIFLQNCSLTMAVATLLDNIGFSNYDFKSISTANDPIIPFFFVEPDTTVADILQRLAQSTQTAMFFDEYNNFVVMPKEYLMPSSSVRDNNTSISERLITLYGQKTDGKLPNIEAINSTDTAIVNDGQINYTTRYIQREVSKLEQAQLDLESRTYGYKSSLLWEAGDQDETRTINQPVGKTGYVLGAVTLNTTLTSDIPTVENGQIINNIIDIGESQIWLPRFQGYLYANGEIIRYDAQEYAVSGVGNVWITSNNQYQKYVSKLPFNGKIYPTGKIRIFVEPFYQEQSSADITGLDVGVTYASGAVKTHGRGQFGTQIVTHSAGLNSYWQSLDNRVSFRMDSQNIFSTKPISELTYPLIKNGTSSSALGEDTSAKSQTRISGTIANFMKQTVRAEANSSTLSQSQKTLQSSALVFEGSVPFTPFPPTKLSGTGARDLLSYVYKDFSNDYRHVGTRMRIIGKQLNDSSQSPDNAVDYYQSVRVKNGDTNLSGGSGGIGCLIDKNTNAGYYFEIMSLTSDILTLFKDDSTNANQVLDNIVFYKIMPNTYLTEESSKQNIAVPVKLWGAEASIIVDSGSFTGMDRLAAQDKPTVYDLGIEFEQVGNSLRFYLYINNTLVATVTDTQPNPIPTGNTFTACLFVRASSKCMFENIYALKNRLSNENVSIVNSSAANGSDISNSLISTVANNSVSISEALRKYAMSALVQSTYMSGINTETAPKYDIYFDEFGTIMRECAYFNIKYDQAYPALAATIVPPFSNEKTYVISGFKPTAYGAEFLIFNSTDKAINLSNTSSNPIMIAGITFTQNISNVLKVDDYFKKVSNLSDPFIKDNVIRSPYRAEVVYEDIKTSRSIYGNKSFSLDSFYIQNEDSANDVMSWIIEKTLKPRKIIELETFATPHLQLGDIAKVNYDIETGIEYIDKDKRFVVTSIKYSRDGSGINNAIRLVEV